MSDTKITPVRADLFRFVTIRTPQLIDSKRKKLWYITHPNPLKSSILKDTLTGTIDITRRNAKNAAESFKKPYLTPISVKNDFSDIYRFSEWIAERRNGLTFDDVKNYISTLTPLTLENKILVWDNLLYQVIMKKQPSVRQALIALIKANYFIEFFQTEDVEGLSETYFEKRKDLTEKEMRLSELLKRLAKSKILLPKCITETKESNTNDQSSLHEDKTIGYTHDLAIDMHTMNTLNELQSSISMKKRVLNITSRGKISQLDLQNTNGFSSMQGYLKGLGLDSEGLTILDYEKGINIHLNKIRDNTIKLSSLEKSSKRHSKPAAGGRYVATAVKKSASPGLYVTMNLPNNTFVTNAEYTIQGGRKKVSGSEFTSILSNTPSYYIPIPENATESDGIEFQGNFSLNDGTSLEIQMNPHFDKGQIYGNTIPVSSGPTSPSPSPSPTPELFGVNRLGVGVYRKVEQEVCCYVPGEVSHIENILAREYKERQTRTLISSETTEEDTTEVESETQNDTTSTSRYELQSEIANVLNTDKSISAGASVGVSGSYAGVTISADGYFDYATTSSSSESDSEAQTYAQEVTNTATERILQKTSSKRTSKILEEYEENNRHGFDNREGTEHVTGVYRWIDIIYNNQLINYGNRLMIEFLIPEPAKFYRQASLEKKSSSIETAAESVTVEQPKKLSQYGITSYEQITEENYLELANNYGITVDDPVGPESQVITASFGPEDDPSSQPNPNADELDYNFTMNFLTYGDYSLYKATQVSVKYRFDYHLKKSSTSEWGTYFKVFVDDQGFEFDKSNLVESNGTDQRESKVKTGKQELTFKDITNSIDISANMKNVWDFNLTLHVTLTLSEDTIISWKKSVYDSLQDAYATLTEEYNTAINEEKALAEEAANEEEATVLSEDTYRSIEQREIERIAIEMLMKPFGLTQGRDFYTHSTSNVPQVKQNKLWEVYSSHVKFFEQAFDWSIMAYLFYPYYWANKSDWSELSQISSSGDSIFDGFMQSGMARVVIPVRPGFEDAIDYYMETGDIWNGGGLVVDMDDDLYISIDQELMEPIGFVEKEWTTRVPTTLNIVQGSSVYLEDEGLPCCGKVEGTGYDTLLRPSTTILGTSSETTES